MNPQTSPVRVVQTAPGIWEVRANDEHSTLLVTAHDKTSLDLFLEAVSGLCARQIEVSVDRYGDVVAA